MAKLPAGSHDSEAAMILVTGATGSFGGPLVEALADRGLAVRAMARRRPGSLPRGVEFVAADVRDEAAVDRAMRGVETVVHLAWLVGIARDPSTAEAINLTGTRNVVKAATDNGVARLVFSSSVMGYGAHPEHPPYLEDEPLRPDPVLQYGEHKRIVEEEIGACGIASVVVRPAVVIGRSVGPSSLQVLATPVLVGVRGEDRPWQFVHQDDVVRFLVDAVVGDRTGTVNLAAPGLASLERVGELLGRRVRRLPAPLLRAGLWAMWHARLSDVNTAGLEQLRAMPVVDTTRLRNDWAFRCAWSCDDAVVDTRRAVAELNLLGRLTRRRRHAPVLPPVGGSRGTVVSPVVARWVADHVEYPALADDLAPAASVDLPEPTPAVVTSWVARETELLLAAAPAGDGDEALRTEARRRQLRDAAVDRIALAVALKDGPDRVSVEEHALRVITALGGLTL